MKTRSNLSGKCEVAGKIDEKSDRLLARIFHQAGPKIIKSGMNDGI
ncbi:MAG: hypothetical protein ABIT23_07315 [Nitrosospira sp.]